MSNTPSISSAQRDFTISSARRDFTRSSFNRREFLCCGLAAAGAGLFGGCTTQKGVVEEFKDVPPPSGRLNMAIIGCGPMGVGNMQNLMKDPRVRFVAACDPIKESSYHGYNAKTLLGRDPAKRMIDKKYGTTSTKSVVDWREVIADRDIDAVLVSTGDYWHALIAAAAMKAGKHVYCQKPLTLNIGEGKVLREIAKKSHVVFQVGSQQRSEWRFRVAAEIIRNGMLSGCTSCTIGQCYAHNDGLKQNYPRDCTPGKIPAWLGGDKRLWDLYLGPTEHWEEDAYIPAIHSPVCWRWNSRTGNGSIADWGAHHFDILQWALGEDETGGPVAIENVKTDIRDPKLCNRYLDQATHYAFDIVYANGFRAHVGDEQTIGYNGLRFHDPKGDLFVFRGKLDLPPALKSFKEDDLRGSDIRLYRNPAANGSHELDFVDAVFSGRTCACSVEVGHRSATVAHLANIAARAGREKVTRDPKAEVFTGASADLNAALDVRYHNGWQLEA